MNAPLAPDSICVQSWFRILFARVPFVTMSRLTGGNSSVSGLQNKWSLQPLAIKFLEIQPVTKDLDFGQQNGHPQTEMAPQRGAGFI